MEMVAHFKYLGSQRTDGRRGRDVINRVNEGYRAWVELKIVLTTRGLRKNEKCL